MPQDKSTAESLAAIFGTLCKFIGRAVMVFSVVVFFVMKGFISLCTSLTEGLDVSKN